MRRRGCHRVQITTGPSGPGSETISIDGRNLNGVVELSLDLAEGKAPLVTLTLHPRQLEIDVEAAKFVAESRDDGEAEPLGCIYRLSAEDPRPCTQRFGHDGPCTFDEGVDG